MKNDTNKLHIFDKNKVRLCRAAGNYEPLDANKPSVICPECKSIHLADTGEVID